MEKISNNAMGAIIALEGIVVGIFIGLKMGFSFGPPSILSYIATFGGNRHVIGTIAALIFIPCFVKQIKYGVLAAIIFISVTIVLTSISVIDLLFITPGFTHKAPVAIIMLILQIIAIMFSYRNIKEINSSLS